jgi:hypothetical protein
MVVYRLLQSQRWCLEEKGQFYAVYESRNVGFLGRA